MSEIKENHTKEYYASFDNDVSVEVSSDLIERKFQLRWYDKQLDRTIVVNTSSERLKSFIKTLERLLPPERPKVTTCAVGEDGNT